jgi:hypothetical protein
MGRLYKNPLLLIQEKVPGLVQNLPCVLCRFANRTGRVLISRQEGGIVPFYMSIYYRG